MARRRSDLQAHTHRRAGVLRSHLLNAPPARGSDSPRLHARLRARAPKAACVCIGSCCFDSATGINPADRRRQAIQQTQSAGEEWLTSPWIRYDKINISLLPDHMPLSYSLRMHRQKAPSASAKPAIHVPVTRHTRLIHPPIILPNTRQCDGVRGWMQLTSEIVPWPS